MPGTDAADDAAAVLEQQQAEQEVDLPEPGAGDVPLFSTGPVSYGDKGRATTSQGSSSGGEVRALEDLYAQYPLLGEGDWKIHIERTAPRSFRGKQTAGFLGECYERLSTAEFKDRFGGASYVVKVLKPTSTGANATKSDYQTVKQFRFRVPGDPTLEGIPERNEEDMVNKFDPRMMMGAVPEKVQIAQLQLEAKREEQQRAERIEMQNRLEQERAAAAVVPPQHLDIIQQSAQHMLADTRASVEAQTAFWQQEVERIRSENAALSAENRRQATELIEAKRESSDTFRVQESQALREAKERYEDRMRESEKSYTTQIHQQKSDFDDERRRLIEENRERLDRVETEHRKQLDEINRRHDEERRQADSRSTEERERLREDYRDRIERVERDKEHRIEQLQQTHRDRIEDLTRSTQREIESLRDQTRREVDGARTVERSQAELAKHSAQTQVTVMESELKRLRDDSRQTRDELRDAQNKIHKEPLQALSDAKEMATQFGGMVEASAVPGERTMIEQLVPALEPLSNMVAPLIDRIGAARVQSQQARGQTVTAPPQHPQLPSPQPRYQSAPMGGAPPAAGSPPAWQPQQSNYQSPPIGGATMAATTSVPFSTTVANTPSPVQPMGGSLGEVGGGGVPMGAGGADGSPFGSEEAPVASVAGPSAPAAAAPQAAQGMPPELHEFCTQLEAVVAGRLMSPKGFAEQVIARIGVQQTAALLQQYRPEHIVSAAAGLGGAGAIQTRDGQKYVHALWQIAGQLVASGATPQPAAPEAGPGRPASTQQPVAPTGPAVAEEPQPAAPEAGPPAPADHAPLAPSTETPPSAEPGAVPITG